MHSPHTLLQAAGADPHLADYHRLCCWVALPSGEFYDDVHRIGRDNQCTPVARCVILRLLQLLPWFRPYCRQHSQCLQNSGAQQWVTLVDDWVNSTGFSTFIVWCRRGYLSDPTHASYTVIQYCIITYNVYSTTKLN